MQKEKCPFCVSEVSKIDKVGNFVRCPSCSANYVKFKKCDGFSDITSFKTKNYFIQISQSDNFNYTIIYSNDEEKKLAEFSQDLNIKNKNLDTIDNKIKKILPYY